MTFADAKSFKNICACASISITTLVLAACGGDDSSPGVKSYTVSAAIFGLLPSTSVVLQNNAGDNLSATSSGTFSFSSPVPSGSAYAVTVLTEPSGETCLVNNGSGTIAGSNVTVSVICPWHVAYIASPSQSTAAGTIAAYYIDPVTGALQAVGGGPFSGGSNPTVVAVTPNHQFLLANQQTVDANGNPSAGYISVYGIASTTGALTPVAGSPFAAGAQPQTVAIEPDGQFVYVGTLGDQNNGGTTPDGIWAYSIGNTGALTPITGSPYSMLAGPVPMVLDPTGAFLFTWDQYDPPSYSPPATYSISASSGALTSIPGSTGFESNDADVGTVAITPNGTFLYSVDGGVYAYAIDSTTGALTSVTGSPFGSAGGTIAISPGSQFAYVADSAGYVWAYAIDQTSGALSTIGGSPYAIAAHNSAIAIDPTGRFLYVSQWQVTSAQPSGGETYAFAVDPSSGALTTVSGSPFAGSGGLSIAITALP